MIANRPPLAVALVALFCCLPLNAQEEDRPSDDFLEYLAAMVEEDGEWVDPLELDELPDEDLDINVVRKQTDDSGRAEDTP